MAHGAEVTIHEAEGSGGDCDQSPLRTTGQHAALSCWGETRGVGEESEGCHTGKRRDQVPVGSTERVQEEKLERQQNRTRKSEEGLRSGGEGKQRLGDGSRPAGRRPRRPASPVHMLLPGQAGR